MSFYFENDDPFLHWDTDRLSRDFERDSMVVIKECAKRPDKYIQEMKRLPTRTHAINDPFLSKNHYQGFVANETNAHQLYRDFYFSDYLLNRVSSIVGKQLHKTPLVTEWIPTHLNGRIHQYAVTRDGQGPHFDRKNYKGNIYTVVYTIYGEPGKTQTLRCWPKNSRTNEFTDVELATNTMTIHKCSDVLHQVVPCKLPKSSNLTPPVRYCVIFQFSDNDPQPSSSDLLMNPIKTAAARVKIAANVQLASMGAAVSACGCNEQSWWIWAGSLILAIALVIMWSKNKRIR